MASIVYQKNKKTGVVYVYESVSYWDKEKKQSRAKRTCIGKLDPETNQIVPTRKKVPKAFSDKPKRGPLPVTRISRKFCGATYLFDRIGEKVGLTDDLKRCFPDTYKQILSIAYYLILEDRNPLSRFPRWSATHRHPHGRAIPSQRSSELFASITEESTAQFFRLQGKRRAEREYWAYDTTSISSYSRCLRQVTYGHNKEHDPLAQLNLAMLFGERSQLPFYYRKIAGHIPDVKALKKLLKDLQFMKPGRVKLVMDKGFYSAENINGLYRNHLKFLVAAKTSLKIVRSGLDSVRDRIRNWSNYSPTYDCYACSIPLQWEYVQPRPYKGDVLKEKRRIYLHLYYSAERAVEQEKAFHKRLHQLQAELVSGNRNPEHETLYNTYFEMTQTPVRGTRVTARETIIAEKKEHFGYFALLSNDIKEPIEALEIYRNKDLVEKAFGNIKDRLNLRRLAVSSEQSLDGKLYVAFVALIILAYIKKRMQETRLFQTTTLQELLDDLDMIESFEYTGHRPFIGEMTSRQTALYNKMDVPPPVSLQ